MPYICNECNTRYLSGTADEGRDAAKICCLGRYVVEYVSIPLEYGCSICLYKSRDRFAVSTHMNIEHLVSLAASPVLTTSEDTITNLSLKLYKQVERQKTFQSEIKDFEKHINSYGSKKAEVEKCLLSVETEIIQTIKSLYKKVQDESIAKTQGDLTYTDDIGRSI